MVFALTLTLVLHSGLQSVMLLIFHIFCIHMDLFPLSLPPVWSHLQFTSIDTVLSNPHIPAYLLHMHIYIEINMHSLHKRRNIASSITSTVNIHTSSTVHVLYSSLKSSILFLFFSPCVFFLPAFSLQQASLTINMLHIIHTSRKTYTGTNTQGN